jgi:hypothetical protein
MPDFDTCDHATLARYIAEKVMGWELSPLGVYWLDEDGEAAHVTDRWKPASDANHAIVAAETLNPLVIRWDRDHGSVLLSNSDPDNKRIVKGYAGTFAEALSRAICKLHAEQPAPAR